MSQVSLLTGNKIPGFLFKVDEYDFAYYLASYVSLLYVPCSLAGINSYVIAFTALAAGTSWPDLVASKIAAERQITADSAIANITCRFHF